MDHKAIFMPYLADLLPFMVIFKRMLWRKRCPPAYHHQSLVSSEQFSVKNDSHLPVLCKSAMHGRVLFVPTSNACHDFFVITQSSGKKNVNNDLVLEINTSYLLFTFLMFRSISPEVLVYEGALNICSKIAGQHPCGSVVSIIKLLGNSMEIILPDGHFPVNLLHILRAPFYKNTFEGLLLYITSRVHQTSTLQGANLLPWKH